MALCRGSKQWYNILKVCLDSKIVMEARKDEGKLFALAFWSKKVDLPFTFVEKCEKYN